MVADIVQPDAKDPLVIDSLIDSSIFLCRRRGDPPLSIRELDPAEQGLNIIKLRSSEVPRESFIIDQPRHPRRNEKVHDSNIPILLLIEPK